MTPTLFDKLKRLGVVLATMATIAVNRKLGLDLDPADVIAIGGLALGYIFQSKVGEVKLAKAELAGQQAAASIRTTSDAIAVLGGKQP